MSFTFKPRQLLKAIQLRGYSIKESNSIYSASHPYSSSPPFGDDDNSNVVVKGWVKAIRKHKDVIFLDIHDGINAKASQVVARPQHFTDTDITFGSAVSVNGVLQRSLGKGQAREVTANDIKVVGHNNPLEYPFKARQNAATDYSRQYPHLRPKTNSFSALLRVRSQVTKAVHDFFHESKFVHIHTPIITCNDCEGAGEVFKVEPATGNSASIGGNPHFFNTPAFLTVSGQLHLEVATGALSKAYTFNPVFRAEKSESRHHLAEFYMIEAEIAFTKVLEDIMQVVENLLHYITEKALDMSLEDINLYHKYVAKKGHQEIVMKMLEKPYIRMSYEEAMRILEKSGKHLQSKVQSIGNLNKEQEQFIVQYCNNTPVFIIDFPTSSKPFYAKHNLDSNNTAAAMDLLLPDVGEVCGGTLREESFNILEPRLQQLNLEHSLQWYLDLRRFGSVPHGGFGIGFERYLQVLLGISNIKDTIPFPRWTHHCQL